MTPTRSASNVGPTARWRPALGLAAARAARVRLHDRQGRRDAPGGRGHPGQRVHRRAQEAAARGPRHRGEIPRLRAGESRRRARAPRGRPGGQGLARRRTSCRSRSTASRSSPTRCSRGSSRAPRRRTRPGCKALLERPGVTERLEQIGVRYVVWLDGSTRKTDSGGSIACAVGPGGGGCFGVGWWEKQSGYVASVWDLRNGAELGSVSTDVTGTSVLIGAVAPIPIITPVQRTACNRLADQLRSFLVGDDLVGGGAAAAAGGAAGRVEPSPRRGGSNAIEVHRGGPAPERLPLTESQPDERGTRRWIGLALAGARWSPAGCATTSDSSPSLPQPPSPPRRRVPVAVRDRPAARAVPARPASPSSSGRRPARHRAEGSPGSPSASRRGPVVVRERVRQSGETGGEPAPQRWPQPPSETAGETGQAPDTVPGSRGPVWPASGQSPVSRRRVRPGRARPRARHRRTAGSRRDGGAGGAVPPPAAAGSAGPSGIGRRRRIPGRRRRCERHAAGPSGGSPAVGGGRRFGRRADDRRGPPRADRPALRRDLRGVRRAHAQGTGSRVAGARRARRRFGRGAAARRGEGEEAADRQWRRRGRRGRGHRHWRGSAAATGPVAGAAW